MKVKNDRGRPSVFRRRCNRLADRVADYLSRVFVATYGTPKRLGIFFLVTSAIGASYFVIVEGKNPIDGFYWAMVTMTTTGYGDIAPTTPTGRALVSLLLVSWFFGIITAGGHAARWLIVNEDDWCHAEQEEVLANGRMTVTLLKWLGSLILALIAVLAKNGFQVDVEPRPQFTRQGFVVGSREALAHQRAVEAKAGCGPEDRHTSVDDFYRQFLSESDAGTLDGTSYIETTVPTRR